MPASFLADTVYQPASSFMAGWMIIHRYPQLSWCMLGMKIDTNLRDVVIYIF